MSNVLKRSLSLLLVFVMLVGMFPVSVLAEEVEEVCEEVVEEVCEEIVEEDEEEIYEEIYEEIVDEVVEDVEEDILEEDTDELVVVGAVSDSVADASVAAVAEEDVDGLVWLDKSKQDELLAYVGGGGLRDMVLEAISDKEAVANGNVKVYYKGVNVADTGNVKLYQYAFELYDLISNYKPVTFTINGGGYSDQTVVVVSRNIQNLKFNVEPVVISCSYNEWNHADVKAAVDAALEGTPFTICFGTEDLTDMTDYQVAYTADYENIGSWTWPGKGKSKTYTVQTVSVTDALETGTKTAVIKVTLQDTTEQVTYTYRAEGTVGDGHTVTGKFGDGKTERSYTVYEGENIPTPEDPTHRYYTFNGWIRSGNTYKPNWQVKSGVADKDSNGIADLEQKYTVWFYNGEELIDEQEVAYGSRPSAPAKETMAQYAPDGKEFGYWEDKDGNMGVSAVTGDAVYKAVWQDVVTDAKMVTYYLYEPENGEAVEDDHYIVLPTTVDGKAQNKEYQEKAFDDTIFLGYWYKDAEGNYTKRHDFDKDPVTEDITLYARWADDKNNNNVVDGTADDPYKVYIHTLKYVDAAGEVYDDLVEKPVYKYEHDGKINPEYEGYEPEKESYTAGDNLNDTVIFREWRLTGEEGEEYGKTTTYVPVFGDDKNQNGVLDSAEIVKVTENKLSEKAGGTITVDNQAIGEKAVYDGYLFEERNDPKSVAPVATFNGFLRKTNDGGEVTVKVTPAKGSYISSIEVCGSQPALTKCDDGVSVTFTIKADGTAAIDTADFEVVVTYGVAEFVAKNQKLTMSELMAQNSYEEIVYNAVIDTPDYSDDAVAIKYLAREATTVKVNVDELKEALEQYEVLYAGIWDKVNTIFGFKEENGHYYYVKDLSARWEEIDAEFGPMTTPEAVVEDFIADLKYISIANLLDQLAALVTSKVDLDRAVEASLVRPFGYNVEQKDTVTEQLQISYKDNKQEIYGEYTVELTENRGTANIGINEKSFDYGVQTSEILGALSCAAGEVKLLVGEFDGTRNAGTYPVMAAFAGNAEFMPCVVNYDVEVEPIDIKLSVDSVTVDLEKNAPAAIKNALKITGANAEGVGLIQVIAGLEMTGFNINNSKPLVTDLQAKAWVKIPESVSALLSLVGYDTTEHRTYTLDEIYEILDTNEKVQKILDKKPELDTYLDKLMKVLEKVKAWAGMNLDIVFTEEYPTEPGVYMNFVTVVDNNYNVTNTSPIPEFEGMKVFGNYVLIHPFVTLPNKGIEFINAQGKPEYVFAFKHPSEVETLKVVDAKSKQPVDAHVYYYGIEKATGEFKLCADGMPSATGLYIASAVLLDQNQKKIGSDVAVVVIGAYDTELSIARTVEEEDGTEYKPEITVINKYTNNPVKDASLIVVSGTMKEQAVGEFSLNSFSGDVTFNIPNALGELWNQFADAVNANKYKDKLTERNLPHYNDTSVEAIEISLKAVKAFLEYSIDNVEKPADVLGRYIGAYVNLDNKYVNYAENAVKRACERLLTEVEKVDAEKLPDMKVTLDFGEFNSGNQNYKGYTESGIYLYFAMVADGDYVPSFGTNVLVIQGPNDSLVLNDQTVPYDGKEHDLQAQDDTNREGFRFIIDREKNTVNLLIDEDMVAALDYLAEKVFGKEVDLNGKSFTIKQLMDSVQDEIDDKIVNVQDKAEVRIAKAEHLADILAGDLEVAIKNRVGAEIAVKNALEAMGTTWEKAMAALENKTASVLEDLAEWEDKDPYKDVTITINGKLPVDVGTYEFRAFSYNIVHAKGYLTIAPITVEVTPKITEKLYGEDDPNWAENAEVKYYSYQSEGGAQPERVEVTLSDEVIEKLNLAYELKRQSGENAGEYTIWLDDVEFNKNIVEAVVLTEEIFTVNKAELKITVGNSVEAYYGKPYEPEYTTDVGLENAEITVTYTYKDENGNVLSEKPVNAGEYTYTAEAKVLIGGKESENYQVVVEYAESAEYGELTIKPAEVTITVGKLEKQFDQEDPNFTEMENAYELTKVQGEISEDEVKALNIQIVRKEAKPDNETLGDTAVLTATYKTNPNIIVTVNDGELSIALGEYVCWNMQTGKYYNDLSVALDEADDDAGNEEVVQMLADFTETDYVIIASGTTLDLSYYTVTAKRSVIGFAGSFITGKTYSTSRAYGKLIAEKDFEMLINDYPEQGCYVDSAGWDVMPIYDGTGYVFGRLKTDTDREANNDQNLGFFVDEVNKTIHFQFYSMSTELVNETFLQDGVVDNNWSVIVRLEWENEKGKASQDFDYNEDYCKEIFSGGHHFTFDLNAYDELGIDPSRLNIKGMIISDCGATQYGDLWVGTNGGELA